MIWKEKGVEKDSYMCFFNPPDTFKQYFIYMFSCGYFQTNSDYLYESEGNRPPLFFYIISGTLHIDYEEQKFTAHENEIVLINCYQYNKYYCEDHCEFLFFHFDGNQAINITEHLIARNQSPIFRIGQTELIYNAICKPIMSLCYQEQISDAQLSALVYLVLAIMQEYSEVSVTVMSLSSSDVVGKSIEYIKNHLSEQISLESLSSFVGLSPYYFSRLFKKETGYAPIEYVSITKINYAKLMLRTTNASISEIADFLGYSSSASFINAFRARRGMSPNQYRHYQNKRR